MMANLFIGGRNVGQDDDDVQEIETIFVLRWFANMKLKRRREQASNVTLRKLGFVTCRITSRQSKVSNSNLPQAIVFGNRCLTAATPT